MTMNPTFLEPGCLAICWVAAFVALMLPALKKPLALEAEKLFARPAFAPTGEGAGALSALARMDLPVASNSLRNVHATFAT